MQRDDIVIVTRQLRIHRLGSHTATCEYERNGQRRFVDIPVEILTPLNTAIPPANQTATITTATATRTTTPITTTTRKYTCSCGISYDNRWEKQGCKNRNHKPRRTYKREKE